LDGTYDRIIRKEVKISAEAIDGPVLLQHAILLHLF